MVEQQITQRGITNESIINAFLEVPRELFVLPKYKDSAYLDIEVPIINGETLDRAYENALMLQALNVQSSDRVLEIGTGSGYFTSLLSLIAKQVYSIEIVPEIAKFAKNKTQFLGYENITIKAGDGFLGWKENAPFDKIILLCSPSQIPQPLIEQVKENGFIMAPMGGSNRFQEIILFQKKNNALVKVKSIAPTNYFPMKGIIKNSSTH